jgi:uncharacterized cupin superfamily protein
MEKNYSLFGMGSFEGLGEKEVDGVKGRIMLGKALGLTGCEVSVNSAAPGGFVPFVHSHKLNEEAYIIVHGKGVFYVDGEEFPVQEGSMIRVAPKASALSKRERKPLIYLCVQAQLVCRHHADGSPPDGIHAT